jgi:hypothetical protein
VLQVLRLALPLRAEIAKAVAGLFSFLPSWDFVGQHAVGANVGIENSSRWDMVDLRLAIPPDEG